MKIAIYLFFLISNLGFAQIPETIIESSHPDYNCKRTKNTSFQKLAASFPLNKTSKIQLVSFVYVNTIFIDNDGNQTHSIIDSLPRIGNKLDYKNLKEVKNLELPKIIELSDILYNFNYDPKKDATFLGTSCYEPRNAIVFLDNQDNIVEYIEICFSCLGFHVFNKSKFGDFCTGKIDLIKNFFYANGIMYGVLKE